MKIVLLPILQEKDTKLFKEKQKQELKLLKQELDMMPRGDNRKENQRKAREAKEIEMQEKVSSISFCLVF